MNTKLICEPRSEAGTTVRFEYDTEEQLAGITNEHGHVYRFELGLTASYAKVRAVQFHTPRSRDVAALS